MADLALNVAMIDWYTITSYDEELGESWLMTVGLDGEYRKIMQYVGAARALPGGGTIFAGKGEIKGRAHFMTYVSGAAADELFWRYREALVTGRARASRIDIQCTIQEPGGWSQLELMAQAEGAGLRPTNRRSPNTAGDGELMTIYIGSRESGRFDRCYEKESLGGERYLRFETQFGRKYANKLGEDLASDRVTVAGALAGQLKRRDGVVMLDVFRGIVGNSDYKPLYKREAGDREAWILNTVVPAVRAYANGHGARQEILDVLIMAARGE